MARRWNPDQKFLDFVVEEAAKEKVDMKLEAKLDGQMYSFEGLVAEMREPDAGNYARIVYAHLEDELGHDYLIQQTDNLDPVR